jgi:hypothetical protein
MFKTGADCPLKINVVPRIEWAGQVLRCCHPCHALWEAAEFTLIFSQLHTEVDIFVWVSYEEINSLSKPVATCANVSRSVDRPQRHVIFEKLDRLEAGLPQRHEDFGVVDACSDLALADVKAGRVEPRCLSELEEEAGSEKCKLDLPYLVVMPTCDHFAREPLHGSQVIQARLRTCQINVQSEVSFLVVAADMVKQLPPCHLAVKAVEKRAAQSWYEL